MEPHSVQQAGSFDEAVRLAQHALRDFPICFWTRQPEARLETREDVALVVRASEADLATLREEGYSSRQEVWTRSFRQAWISRGDNGVKLEWCHDSAWRFFPIEQDDLPHVVPS